MSLDLNQNLSLKHVDNQLTPYWSSCLRLENKEIKASMERRI